MDKHPNKNKHWAQEALGSLELAFNLLHEDEYAEMSFEDKQMEMLNLAPAIACMRRKIKDDSVVKKTYDFVFENIKEDFRLGDPDEETNFEILFILAYLDSHISFKIITEARAEKIMDHIIDRYEIPKFA